MTDKTTNDFKRIEEMGYPEGCHLWNHATTYANHRIWKREMQKTRRNAFLITAFVVVISVPALLAGVAG